MFPEKTVETTEAENKRASIENTLVGMLIASGQTGEILGDISPDDFRISAFRDIVAHIAAEWKRKGTYGTDDIINLPEELRRTALVSAASVVGQQAEPYCEALKLLNTQEGVQRIAGQLLYCDTLETMSAYAEELMRTIQGARTARETESVKELFENFMREQNAPREYIKTGYGKLDKYTYIERGDYIVIGARPSEGKTALALNLAARMAERGLRVGFFTLETAPQKLTDRLVSSVCGLDYGTIKRGELDIYGWRKVFDEAERFDTLPIWFIPASGKTVAWIRSESARLSLDIAFIDYLSLVRAKGRDIYERTSTISMELHEFAQQSKTVVIALSQLNRGDSSKKPTLERLRESGQIEQDADVVILLHNPPANLAVRECTLVIAKNKEGLCGTIKMNFVGANQRFTDEYKGADRT